MSPLARAYDVDAFANPDCNGLLQGDDRLGAKSFRVLGMDVRLTIRSVLPHRNLTLPSRMIMPRRILYTSTSTVVRRMVSFLIARTIRPLSMDW